MGKKRKLAKLMRKRKLGETAALVICVGKDCCPRAQACALVEATQTYALDIGARTSIVTVGCLHVCKHGPIVATYPDLRFKKHVTPRRARKMLDKLERRLTLATRPP